MNNLETRTMKEVFNVATYIQNVLGKQRATWYFESAPMFNAVVESSIFSRSYFMESSQFVSSDGSEMDRVYSLKCVDQHISVIKDFSSKAEAMALLKAKETTRDGALVLKRELVTRDMFDHEMFHKMHCEKHYDNGLSALFSLEYKGLLFVYTEGDLVTLHCRNAVVFEAVIMAHIDHHVENEG